MTDMLSTLASGFGDKALMLVNGDGSPAGHITGSELEAAIKDAKKKLLPVLPNGYEALEYLQSDGDSFIDTGFYNYEVDQMKGTVSFTSLGSDLYYVAGARPSTSSSSTTAIAYALYHSGHGGLTYSPYGWADASAGAGVDISVGQVVAFDTYIGNDSASFAVDGVIINSVERTITKGSAKQSIYLFALHTRQTYQYCGSNLRIHELSAYFEGTKLAHYIPAKRTSDNEVGMYDLVTNTFLLNAGNGTFSYY